jgi:glutamyl-tRNA reductase
MDSSSEAKPVPNSPSERPQFLLMGANHITASVDLRDRLLFNPQAVQDFVSRLQEHSAVQEIVVLSTCNRSEVYVASPNPEATRKAIVSEWARLRDVSESEITGHSYCYVEGDAIRHLFRVMGSLDSLVLGEMQILGQVKDAYQRAIENRWTDLHLNKLFQAGIHVGKRIHSETTIHEGAVSISYAAVMLAKKVLGDLRGKTVGLVGTGEMGELAAQHLHKAGVSQFVIFNRSLAGAEKLAADFGGEIALLPDLEKRLHVCDIVISATGSPDIVVTRKHAEIAAKQRGGHPLFLIDIAAPRDIDPACGEVDNTFLFTIDDLMAIVKENQDLRRQAAEKAQAIVEEEAQKVEAWSQSLDLVPIIKALRASHQNLVDKELEKWTAGQPPEVQKQLEGLARGLMNKFLHAPTTGLRVLGEMGDGARAGNYARTLFGLNDMETRGGNPSPTGASREKE